MRALLRKESDWRRNTTEERGAECTAAKDQIKDECGEQNLQIPSRRHRSVALLAAERRSGKSQINSSGEGGHLFFTKLRKKHELFSLLFFFSLSFFMTYRSRFTLCLRQRKRENKQQTKKRTHKKKKNSEKKKKNQKRQRKK